MNRCPIAGLMVEAEKQYSPQGLRLLSPQLKLLQPLIANITLKQREKAAEQLSKAVQGSQVTTHAFLRVQKGYFILREKSSPYIVKFQHHDCPELPENEAITMKLASMLGLPVPLHGLLHTERLGLAYFMKRFEISRGHIAEVNNFAELSESIDHFDDIGSLEHVAHLVTTFCSFPVIEKVTLLKTILFHYLIGNEELTLNKLAIVKKNEKVTLAPVVNALSTGIIPLHQRSEMALSLNGKRNELEYDDFFEYFAKNILQLNKTVIASVVEELKLVLPKWQQAIKESFLSGLLQWRYIYLIEKKSQQLALK